MSGLELVSRQEFNRLTTGLVLTFGLASGVSAVWHFRRRPHPLIDLSSLRVPTFAVTIWAVLYFASRLARRPSCSRSCSRLVWHERVHFRPAGFRGLRRQSSNEACDDANTSALWISHSAHWQWSACCAYDSRLRPFHLVHAKGDHFCGAICRRLISVDAVHQLKHGRLRRYPAVPNEQCEHLSSMIQQMTIGMGIAFGAIALRLAGALHSTIAGSPTTDDFRIAFVLVGAIALLAVIDSFRLAPSTGAELSGHRFTRGPLPADSSRHGSSSDAGPRPVISKSDPLLRLWRLDQIGCADSSRPIDFRTFLPWPRCPLKRHRDFSTWFGASFGGRLFFRASGDNQKPRVKSRVSTP
jgi:hypothetical protein